MRPLDYQNPRRHIINPTDDNRGTLTILANFYSIIGALELTGIALFCIVNFRQPIAHKLAFLIPIPLPILLSGLFMRARRFRLFSVIIAAIACLLFPLRTLLGAWTIIVLAKPGSRTLYRMRQTNESRP